MLLVGADDLVGNLLGCLVELILAVLPRYGGYYDGLFPGAEDRDFLTVDGGDAADLSVVVELLDRIVSC